MKKFFLAALVLAVVTVNKKANAQQGFSVSVKTTPQFSSLRNKDDRDNGSIEHKATVNASFGIGAGYNFTPKLGVGMDVLYSSQGQRYEIDGMETKQNVNYVKIPVYFTYNGNPNKPISFVGKIGPQLSVLTNSKLTDNIGNTLKSDTKDLYKNVTFGGMAAGGAQFKLESRLFLTTMVHFDYDFTNAEDHNNPYYPAGRAKTHNMTTGVEVGFKYML
jgi:Outer membrane protein beta-barrel domain